MISSLDARDRMVAPAMEALAISHREELLLCNPSTPEPDSLLEHLALLGHHGVDRTLLRPVVDGVQHIRGLNFREAGFERNFLGAADQLAVDLRRLESNDPEHRGSGARNLAADLRLPLQILGAREAESAGRVGEACRQLERVCARVPREKLLTPALENQLRGRLMGVLRDYLADREEGLL